MNFPHRYWPMSENCQNLNVWTPACDDAKRPVMLWLHGGGKVTALLQTPAADGLYAKGIIMSGVLDPVITNSKGDGKDLVEAVMKELGIKDVKALEDISYEAFAAAYLKVKPSLQEAGKYVVCSPYQNAFYEGDPAENGFRSETKDIPLLVGSVFSECNAFMPTDHDRNSLDASEGTEIVEKMLGKEACEKLLPLFNRAYPERNPVDLINLDFFFRLPELKYIKQRSALNQCTYAYLFNYDLPVNGGRPAWHCSDIPYVFHNTDLVPVTQDDFAETLEKQIFESVMAFAYTGNPSNKEIPKWPASTKEDEYTMVFGRETCVRVNHDAELIPLLAKNMGPVFMRKYEEHMKEV